MERVKNEPDFHLKKKKKKKKKSIAHPENQTDSFLSIPVALSISLILIHCSAEEATHLRDITDKNIVSDTRLYTLKRQEHIEKYHESP